MQKQGKERWIYLTALIADSKYLQNLIRKSFLLHGPCHGWLFWGEYFSLAQPQHISALQGKTHTAQDIKSELSCRGEQV